MTTLNHRLGWALTASAGVVIFVAFTAWGGIPAEMNASLFWAQAGLFLLALCVFVLAFWHLLLRPLAPNLRQATRDTLTVKLRQRLALILAAGGLTTFVGAFWDEIWHRVYGIPFGEDLFWRPHLLMYFGFATAAATGFWALLYLNRQLRGNFQQRFRANPIIGLLILNAAFLCYALPADPVWHWIFGEDITAWSIPHLILLASFVLTQLLALFIYTSTLPLAAWRSAIALRTSDLLALLILAGISLLWLQIMLIDWDATLFGIQPESLGLYRPEWLLAANLTAGLTFFGMVSTRLLRCAGAATIVGLLALAMRYGMIQLFQTDMLQFVAWICALLPLLALDLYTYYRAILRNEEPDWRGTAVAVIAAMTLNALVIRSLYNLVDADNLAYAAAIIVSGIGMSWLANRVTDAMLRQPEAIVAAPSERNSIKPAVSFGILAAFLAYILFFIATASPPV